MSGGGQRRLKKWTPQTLKMRTKRQYTVTHWHSIVSQGTSIHIKVNEEAPDLMFLLFLIRREGAVFRVYVVMPLLPGFEGEVGSPSGTALHAITHWNYASICRYVLCPQATSVCLSLCLSLSLSVSLSVCLSLSLSVCLSLSLSLSLWC